MKTVYVVAVIVGEEIDVEATFSTRALALDFVQKRDAKGFQVGTRDIYESVIDECIDYQLTPVFRTQITGDGPETWAENKMLGADPYEETHVYRDGLVIAYSSVSKVRALEVAEAARKEYEAASAD